MHKDQKVNLLKGNAVYFKAFANEDDTHSLCVMMPVDHLPVGSKNTVFNELDKDIATDYELLMAFRVKTGVNGGRARQVTVSFTNSGLKTIGIEGWTSGTLGGGATWIDNGVDSILEIINYDANFTFTPDQPRPVNADTILAGDKTRINLISGDIVVWLYEGEEFFLTAKTSNATSVLSWVVRVTEEP